MRKIAGAFRTTPIAAVEAGTALAPTPTRLDEMQRKWALRILSMPPRHPLIPLCPESWPNTPEDNLDVSKRSRP